MRLGRFCHNEGFLVLFLKQSSDTPGGLISSVCEGGLTTLNDKILKTQGPESTYPANSGGPSCVKSPTEINKYESIEAAVRNSDI